MRYQEHEEAMKAELAKHRNARNYGPKQGAECTCGTVFHPRSMKLADLRAAHAEHQAAALSIAGFGSIAVLVQWVKEQSEETK